MCSWQVMTYLLVFFYLWQLKVDSARQESRRSAQPAGAAQTLKLAKMNATKSTLKDMDNDLVTQKPAHAAMTANKNALTGIFP